MEFTVSLPEWAQAEVQGISCIKSLEERMRAVIRFSRLNIQHATGGPFAAGVFEEATGQLVAMGVNRVVPTCCSSAHAEVVAVSLAQRVLKSFDLGAEGMPRHQLVVNWRPCAMCYGAVLWSGARYLRNASTTVILDACGRDVFVCVAIRPLVCASWLSLFLASALTQHAATPTPIQIPACRPERAKM